MTIINRLKRRAKMIWFIRIWYKLTMFFTQVKGHKLAKYNWINQIPEALKFGDLYVPDPKNLDVQYHPSKIQKWLDTGKPRHFDCLPQETLLLRNDGKFIPIKDIEIGNVIHDGSGWVKVLLKSEPSQKKILCFKLNNGSVLRCSPEHRVFLTNGKVVRAEDLKLEDRLLQPNEEFAGGNYSLTEDEALIVGSYISEGWKEQKDQTNNPRIGIAGVAGSKGIREAVISLASRNGWTWGVTKRQVNLALPKNHVLLSMIKEMGERALGKMFSRVDFDKESAASLFSWMMRGDGTYCGRNKNIPVYSTISTTLAYQFRVLCRIMGKSTHMRLCHKHGGLGKNPIWRITVRSSNKRTCAIVRDIVEEQEQTCYDIMTETSRIYLPESDVIVHNCDDHAIYWCTVIKKYNLARKVYIGFVYMVGADNKSMGHAVCVYEGWDGVVSWGDYGYPTPVKDAWEFANVAEDRYKAKKVSAALVEIRKVKGDCTPMYGKSSYKIYD